MFGAKIWMEAEDEIRITSPDESTEYRLRAFEHIRPGGSVAMLRVRQAGHGPFVRYLLNNGTETWHSTEPRGKWGWLLDLCREAGVVFPGEEE